MSDTNMDIRHNLMTNVPILEFTLPISELEIVAEMGQTGDITIPVEIIAVDATSFTLRKIGKATTSGDFKPETVANMRKRIGIVTDLDEPLNKDA